MKQFIIQNKGKLILTLALLAGALFAIRTRAQGSQSQQLALFNKTPKEEIITPQTSDLSSDIILAGSINALNLAEIRFQTSGRLSWVGVRVGDRVKKWQAIASLDRSELKKKLEKDLNDYKSALHDFEDDQQEYKDEKDRYLLTDEMKRILDRSQNTLNNSVIDYELSELALKYATIYSPIDGIVIGADQPLANINITPATATYTIVDPQSIYFTADIDQEDVINIRTGQTAKLTLDSFPDKSFDSQITYISFAPVSTGTSPKYEVRFHLAPSPDLRLGMTGDALISLSSSQNALTVPLEAIETQDDKTFVYVKQDGQTVKREVETGIETDQVIEITSGINLTDQIVIPPEE